MSDKGKSVIVVEGWEREKKKKKKKKKRLPEVEVSRYKTASTGQESGKKRFA